MPKYWVKNYFAHGSFPEVGQKQKTEEKEERLNDGDNNGQATHGARKHAWRTQVAWANIFFWHISSSYAKILGDSPKWVKSKKRRKILQGLRVAQAAVTERWP